MSMERDNSLTEDCDVFPWAPGEDRRPSIVYEEDMPVIVRRRGVTMTVRIFGAEEDQGPGQETGDQGPRQETGGARVARSASCSDPPSCGSPTKRFSLAARKKRTSKSVSSLEDVREGSILSEWWIHSYKSWCYYCTVLTSARTIFTPD